jgi:hypothetical protein
VALSATNRTLVRITEHAPEKHFDGASKSFTIDAINKTTRSEVMLNLASMGTTISCRNTSISSVARLTCPPARKLGIVIPVNIHHPASILVPSYSETYSKCKENVHATGSVAMNENDVPIVTIPATSWKGLDNAIGTSDKTAVYNCTHYGSPIPAYYSEPWHPVFGVFDASVSPPKLLRIVNASVVLWEVNGRYTFNYNTTVGAANCRGAPQTWSKWREAARSLGDGISPSVLWNSTSYINCNSPLAPPLTEAAKTAQYEVLSGYNSISWQGRAEGIYMFKARVLDPEFRFAFLSLYQL